MHKTKGIFFYFDLFKQYLRNKSGQKFFLNPTLLSRASALGATHFHVNIDDLVNLTSPITTFGTQNKSHHFKWRDSSMSDATPFAVTNFGAKSASLIFLLFTVFL
jgi:hypothetical protein